MGPKLLIVGGTVVNDDAMFEADVLVENGTIKEVRHGLAQSLGNDPNIRVIDADGRFVIPGGIDPHTHMQLPTMGTVTVDDFFHGTRAALAGGTTMVIDFVVPSKESVPTPLAAYRQWREWADPKVCCDFAFSVAITSWDEQIAAEMEELVKQNGVNSFKFYLAYENVLMVNDREFYEGLKQCARLKALARVHAENGPVIAVKEKELLKFGVTGPEGHTQSRPEELEAEATNRACTIAAQANCPLYVVHVMSKGAAQAIASHRQKGSVIFGEPIAAGLALDGRHYYNKDFDQAAKFIMSPPLSRDPTTPQLLMDLLACGQLNLTATDNCTFSCHQKRLGIEDFTKIPNGINGLEDRMSIVWEKGVCTGKLDPMRFVAVTSSTAAKIFNIYPRKGRIAEGSDADIVIWNPNRKRTISAKTHHHAADQNIFEGLEVHGVAEVTISRGCVVWENGKLNVEAGTGKFVPLPPNSPIVFGTHALREELCKPKIVKRNIAPLATNNKA